SMVIPLSLSSLMLSSTQAYLKVSPFPVDSDSFAKASIVLWSITPISNNKSPTIVDLPLSTWPTTTRFMCGFLLALIMGRAMHGLYFYFVSQYLLNTLHFFNFACVYVIPVLDTRSF